jgi:malonyl-CoA O-methyltransferase
MVSAPSSAPATGTTPAARTAISGPLWRPRAGMPPVAVAPWLHTEIARRMAERLSFIRQQPQQVLDWWSERSGSAEALAQHCPQALLREADATGQPSSALPRPWWQRWRGTGESAARAPVDMLWANMVLHWADEPDALLAAWHTALEADGFLMFSCLGPDSLQELHAVYGQHGWGPAGRPFPDMHDIGDGLVKAGFADPVMDMEKLRLTWDSPQALLDELMTLGRNTHPQRHAGLRSRAWCEALYAGLEGLRGPDGRLGLTFEVIYGHAFRPPPRPAVARETSISLDEMRQMTRKARHGPS